MAFPTVAWNSSGSDSAASGAGPGTAITGSLAATHSNNTINITDAVDLSGVDTTGLALLYVASSSGRQAARITAISGSVSNWTVTTAESYANTESGRTWAIGGKRQTLDGSTQFGLDARGGWTYDIQTDQTITANFRLTPNAVVGSPFTIKSSVGTRTTKVQGSTNSIVGLDLAGASNVIVSNLYFKTTAATVTDGITCASASAATNVVIDSCVIDGFLIGIRLGDSGANVRMQDTVIRNCEIKNSTQNAVWNQISGPPLLQDCWLHDNGSASSGSTVYPALGQGSTATTWQNGVACNNVVFSNNYGPAVHCATPDPSGSAASVTTLAFKNCNFYKNCRLGGATAGVQGDINISSTGSSPLVVTNCVFYGSSSGNFAIKNSGGSGVTNYVSNNNAYGVYTTNTSGTGLSSGNSPVTLTGDPFTSSTDFSLNGTAGAGAGCKQAGFSQSLLSATAPAPDVGAVQSGSTATGGGGPPGVMVVGGSAGAGWEY